MGTWFKWSNDLVDDPRFVGLSDAAWTLHLHGASYCSRNLTDGFIPTLMLPRLCGTRNPAKAAAELVDVGMWTSVAGGWRIEGFEDEQQTREKVERTRAQAKERQQRKRSKPVTRDVTDVSQRDNSVTSREVREPDTDTDTDTTNSRRLTGLRAAVDNDELATTWIRNHLDHKRHDIDNPGAMANWLRPKVLEVIARAHELGHDPRFDLYEEWPVAEEHRWPGAPPDHDYDTTPETAVTALHQKLAQHKEPA